MSTRFVELPQGAVGRSTQLGNKSAGLLIYREGAEGLEVFLVHPGGPFWARKDDGAWSIPKGEFEDPEDPLEAAKREFKEETGVPLEVAGTATGGESPGEHPGLIRLDPVRQPGGKVVYAWALRGSVDPGSVRSNTFIMEWPPKSGRLRSFPEIDRAGWFGFEAAMAKILPAQRPLLDQLWARAIP